MATFTREQLESKTAKELKNMCVYELGLPGLTKKDKGTVIDAIMAKYGRKTSAKKASVASAKPAAMAGVAFQAQSTITKPSAPFGHKTTTTVNVTCGASSGAFPVIGRSVKEVGEFLREVLNVDRLSTGLVNGKDSSPDYVLKEGDTLEFLKPAGKKGC